MPSILILLIALLTTPLHAQEPRAEAYATAETTCVLPSEVRAGDAVLIWIPRKLPESGFFGEAVLKTPDGAVLKTAPASYLPGAEGAGWDVCAVGLPMNAKAGIYTVEIRGARVEKPYTRAMTLPVIVRKYLSEDIPLGTGLTAIRTEPSARKDEEARIYAEVLGRVDPSGVWLDGPFIQPVVSNRRTSFFGDQRRYLYATGGSSTTVHMGIDFAAPTGTPVVAAARGRVVLAADRVVTGKTVILEHLPGVYTIYMHMNALAVSIGDIVERGGALGVVGATGLATGPHLHWELRVLGDPCDPESPSFAALFPTGLTVRRGADSPAPTAAPTP